MLWEFTIKTKKKHLLSNEPKTITHRKCFVENRAKNRKEICKVKQKKVSFWIQSQDKRISTFVCEFLLRICECVLVPVFVMSHNVEWREQKNYFVRNKRVENAPGENKFFEAKTKIGKDENRSRRSTLETLKWRKQPAKVEPKKSENWLKLTTWTIKK